jgi:cell division protein FtsB
MARQITPAMGGFLYLTAMFLTGGYFTFAAVQGDFGVFRQVEIEADARVLRAEKAQLEAALAVIENRTMRLSDGFLDIDLLDEQVRDVLGYVRADEVIVD